MEIPKKRSARGTHQREEEDEEFSGSKSKERVHQLGFFY
jgi:hypothetical protein